MPEALRKQGRPPEGEHGSRVADYPRITLRLPPVTAAKLRAWSDISGIPVWQLIGQSVEASIGQLTGEDAALLARLAKRYIGRLRKDTAATGTGRSEGKVTSY